MQADVQGVQHEAAARNAEVALHVLGVVPGQRRDPIPALETQPGERDRELLRAPHQVAVVRPLKAPVRLPADDLLAGEVGLGTAEQRRDRQLEVHHLPAHAANCTALPVARQRRCRTCL